MAKLNFDARQFEPPSAADRLELIVHDNLPDMKKEFAVYAKVRRALYQAYIDEGFTEEQAFTLCQQPYAVRQ